MINDDRIYFAPGDIVKLRHENISYRPAMYVVEKISRSIVNKNGDRENVFIGIKTRWFSNDYKLQEAIFSTKDLIHYEE
jgi:hypothetical protein